MGRLSKRSRAQRENGLLGGRNSAAKKQKVEESTTLNEPVNPCENPAESSDEDTEEDSDVEMEDEDDRGDKIEAPEFHDLMKWMSQQTNVDAESDQMRKFMTSDVEDLRVRYERGLKPSRMTEWREKKKAEEKEKASADCKPLTHWFQKRQEVSFPLLCC